MLNVNTVISILVAILFDAIIFNIIYSAMNSGYEYVKNALIYAIGMSIKLVIITRVSLVVIFSYWIIFLLPFAAYFVVGLALMYILNKLYDHLVDRITFTIISILIQIGITSLLNLFLLI